MTWQGVEMEIQVPCAEGKRHPVRLRFTGWGEYEVVHNPCEELLGAVFARMAPCTHYLREQFPKVFRQDARFRKQLVEALGAVGTPAVPPLIQALGDRDRDVCVAACRALGAIGDGQAVPPLIQALGDGDSDVRAAACEALGEIGDGQAVPPLIQALRDRDRDVRVAACEALGAIGDGQAVPALSVWAHAGERVAQAALQQMGQAPLPLPEAVAQVVAQGAWGVLVRALRHEAVRAAVVELGTPAVPHLIQALGDGDSDVRAAACWALGEIGDRQAVPPLIQALGDGDGYVRAAACRALGEIGDRQAVPPLIQALRDGDSDVRAAACEALGAIGDGQAVPALSVWAHAGERVAQAALQQMGQAPLPLPEAVAQVVAQGAWGVLVRALRHEAVRAAVVELGTPAVPHLIQALGDRDWDVRVAACRALGAIGDGQAVPPLIQALGDWNSDVRAAACRALVKIGAPAVPHLIQALGDGNRYVREAAREAVEQIKAKQFARDKPLD
jgi:HEAT repeat protein